MSMRLTWRTLGLAGIVAMFAAATLGCAQIFLGPNFEAWLHLDPRPRVVRVELDPSLSPEGAWRVGHNSPRPGTRMDGVEVVLERIGSESICVEVRATWNDRKYSCVDKLWLDFDVQGAPSARAKVSALSVDTTHVFRLYGLRGTVRVSSTSLSPPADGSSTLILEYEFEGWISGSDDTRRGKVALDLATLR